MLDCKRDFKIGTLVHWSWACARSIVTVLSSWDLVSIAIDRFESQIIRYIGWCATQAIPSFSLSLSVGVKEAAEKREKAVREVNEAADKVEDEKRAAAEKAEEEARIAAEPEVVESAPDAATEENADADAGGDADADADTDTDGDKEESDHEVPRDRAGLAGMG